MYRLSILCVLNLIFTNIYKGLSCSKKASIHCKIFRYRRCTLMREIYFLLYIERWFTNLEERFLSGNFSQLYGRREVGIHGSFQSQDFRTRCFSKNQDALEKWEAPPCWQSNLQRQHREDLLGILYSDKSCFWFQKRWSSWGLQA